MDTGLNKLMLNVLLGFGLVFNFLNFFSNSVRGISLILGILYLLGLVYINNNKKIGVYFVSGAIGLSLYMSLFSNGLSFILFYSLLIVFGLINIYPSLK